MSRFDDDNALFREQKARDARPNRWRRVWSWEPHWLVRDGALALGIGLLLFGGQWFLDDRRAEREERLENLRFVRERALIEDAERGDRPFAGLDLAGMDLRGLNLQRADLRDNLSEAKLLFADLSSADLTGADLSGADFTDVCHDEWTEWGDYAPPRTPNYCSE